MKSLLTIISILIIKSSFCQSWNPQNLNLPENGEVTVKKLKVIYLRTAGVNNGHQYLNLNNEKIYLGTVKFSKKYFEMQLNNQFGEHLQTFYFFNKFNFKVVEKKDDFMVKYAFDDIQKDGAKSSFEISIMSHTPTYDDVYFKFSYTKTINSKVVEACIMSSY